MSYPNSNLIGNAPGATYNGFIPDTIQRHPLGLKVWHRNRYWGPRRLIYAKNDTSAIEVGKIMTLDFNYLATASAVTGAALGAPVVISAHAMDASTYGWFFMWGLAPVWSYATCTVEGLVNVDSAHAGGLVDNGAGHLPINGLCVLQASTGTVTGTMERCQKGAYEVVLNDNAGFFKGLYVTGTGPTDGALVTQVLPDGKTIILDTVNDAQASSGTLTGTLQGTSNVFWSKCRIAYPKNAWAVT
jgi:hypothetical protein